MNDTKKTLAKLDFKRWACRRQLEKYTKRLADLEAQRAELVKTHNLKTKRSATDPTLIAEKTFRMRRLWAPLHDQPADVTLWVQGAATYRYSPTTGKREQV
jgi:hypothetical protein